MTCSNFFLKMFKCNLLLFLSNILLAIELSAPREKQWSEIEETVEYWKDVGKLELERAKNVKKRNHKAKNVIFFMGDGMGIQGSFQKMSILQRFFPNYK